MKQKLPKLYCRLHPARVAVASLLGALTAFGSNEAVLAAGTCIERPNLKAGQGVHWYYRVDRINHRKCWYVMDEDLSLEPPPYLPWFSWFTPLGAGPPRSAMAGLQSDTTEDSPSAAREPPNAVGNERSPRARSALAGMRSIATKESRVPPAASIKSVHAVQKERPRPARALETNSAASAEQNQRSPSLSSAVQAEQVNSQPPDQAVGCGTDN
jgi:hypothetical protein